MNQELLDKASNIIALHTVHSGLSDKILVCALGMMELDGTPTVAAITAAQAEGMRWITFSTGLSSNKVKRLARCSKASVCFLSETYNVSLMGSLEVLTDPASKRATWYDALGHHFSGPDDPEYCVLKFTTESYNLLIDWQELRGML
jgi:general stress protein 26